MQAEIQGKVQFISPQFMETPLALLVFQALLSWEKGEEKGRVKSKWDFLNSNFFWQRWSHPRSCLWWQRWRRSQICPGAWFNALLVPNLHPWEC